MGVDFFLNSRFSLSFINRTSSHQCTSNQIKEIAEKYKGWNILRLWMTCSLSAFLANLALCLPRGYTSGEPNPGQLSLKINRKHGRKESWECICLEHVRPKYFRNKKLYNYLVVSREKKLTCTRRERMEDERGDTVAIRRNVTVHLWSAV